MATNGQQVRFMPSTGDASAPRGELGNTEHLKTKPTAQRKNLECCLAFAALL